MQAIRTTARSARQPDKREPKQPLSILSLPDAMLTTETVEAISGLSISTINRQIKNGGDFPKPIKFGPRCTRWRAGDVTAWLAAHKAGTAHWAPSTQTADIAKRVAKLAPAVVSLAVEPVPQARRPGRPRKVQPAPAVAA